MTITEVVLIITLGYSPSSASGVHMIVKEYKQPNMEVCTTNKELINKGKDGRFDYYSLCVERVK